MGSEKSGVLVTSPATQIQEIILIPQMADIISYNEYTTSFE